MANSNDSLFSIKDIICALGVATDNKTYQPVKKVVDYVENFVIGGMYTMPQNEVLYMVEQLEIDELIDVNWDLENPINSYFITNF